ncbi:acyltransferase family protein [Sphingomonas sp. Leaf357]|uniref:acyltransferase family protein n=1 Tax=Sphingomonas sp. Leaf357 TaxID=1736350 RepID=UPI000B103FBA|nr:acyltransferase [Sphingomonas sp. Leaf357]
MTIKNQQSQKIPNPVATTPAGGRFEALDALRGLCAIAVLFYHASFISALKLAPSAYLAVDMFFLMSGFVIAHAYEGRLLAGKYFQTFLIKRYGRFAPMWLIGVGLGFIATIPGNLHSHDWLGGFIAVITALALMPSPTSPTLFPLSTQGWSLFGEIMINLAYGAALVRLSTLWLAFLTALTFAILVVDTVARGKGLDFGYRWDEIDMTFLRATFGFLAGVVLCRMVSTFVVPPLPDSLAWVIFGAVIVIMLSPVPNTYRAGFDLTTILTLFPLIVLLLSQAKSSHKSFEVLGAISYPLYTIHLGVFMIIQTATGLVTNWRLTSIDNTSALFICIILINIAYIFGKWIDPWCQGAIAKRLRITRPHLPGDGKF